MFALMMEARKNSPAVQWLFVLLPLLFLPVLWVVYPVNIELGESTLHILDTCDTRDYNDWTNHIGYRMVVILFVKFFKLILPGITNWQIGTIFNSITVLGMFLLLRKYFRVFEGRELSPVLTMVYICMSPIVVLTGATISTDFYAGVLASAVLLDIEALRHTGKLKGVPVLRILIWSAALMVSWSIKETIIFLFIAYAPVFVLRSLADVKSMMRTAGLLLLFCGILLGLEMLIQHFLYGDFLYKFRQMTTKHHGGNDVSEIGGATSSVPVPLAFYHVFSHVKTYGRMGLAGLISLGACVWYGRHWVAQLYISATVVFMALGATSRFVMERYWLIIIVIEIILVAKLLEDLKTKNTFMKWAWWGVAGLALLISFYNFAHRWNAGLV